MKTRILFLILSLFALASAANAKLQLPAIIGDHMVLQQKTPVAIWGWSDPGQVVNVSLAGKTASATADTDGKWKAVFPLLKTGGPYDMVVTGAESVTVKDILVGEVWIGSGQSNMELAMRVTRDAATEIAAANYPELRLFTLDRSASHTPKEDVVGSWKVCTPDSARDFSAVAYHFGKEIHKALKVPVGIIASTWGGAPGEDFIPRPALDNNPAFTSLLDRMDHDEAQIKTWTKGYDFEFVISDLHFVTKDGGKSIPINLPKGQKGFGGEWAPSAKPGSAVTFTVGGKSFSGSGAAASFTGLMEGGSWGSILTNLDSKTTDLTPYEAIEFYVKGHGKFSMNVGQASITDYDYYNSGPFDLTPEWKLMRFPIASLKQGGWGTPKPFTPDQVQSLSFSVQPPYWPEVPALIYNGMIAPLTPYKMRGVLWYQGESNVGRANQYHEVLSTLIKSWREAWDEKDFPFLIIQLPNYMQTLPDPSESGWAELREAQLKTLDVPHTGLVTTIDLGEAGDIHPKNKTDVGKRACLAALAVAYHKPVVGSGPLFASASVKGDKMVVKFTQVGRGLITKDGGPVTGFALAGSDHKFHWAQAVIGKGGVVVVSCDQVPEPVEVRYAWADNPVCNLYNKAGLPASPFRYSTKPMKETPVQPVAKGKTLFDTKGKFLVDDFESGKTQSLLGGPWQVQMDNGGLGTLIKNKDEFIVKGGANGSKGSARIFGHFGKLVAPWPYASLYTTQAQEEPMDLSDYKAIEFWARGDGKNYEVQLFLTQVTDYAHYRLSFQAPKAWTKVRLELSTFHQPDWGSKVPQDFQSVKEIIFAPQGMNDEDFDLSIDDVTLVK